MEAEHSDSAMRHSCAHLLGAAIQDLWPRARFGVGPAVEHGFYYDVELPAPIHDADLARIEDRMRHLQARNDRFLQEFWQLDEALQWMPDRDQIYKAELIDCYALGARPRSVPP